MCARLLDVAVVVDDGLRAATQKFAKLWSTTTHTQQQTINEKKNEKAEDREKKKQKHKVDNMMITIVAVKNYEYQIKKQNKKKPKQYTIKQNDATK